MAKNGFLGEVIIKLYLHHNIKENILMANNPQSLAVQGEKLII